MHEEVKRSSRSLEPWDAERCNDDMLRWARVPVAVFALVFAGSLAYFELLDDGAGSSPRSAAKSVSAPGRLVVTYSATARNPDRGFLGTSPSMAPTCAT
jgi:hypothetical protein